MSTTHNQADSGGRKGATRGGRRPAASPSQLSLFDAVAKAYVAGDGQALAQRQLYQHLVDEGHISEQDLRAKAPVGRAAAPVSISRRQVRWIQQSLRALNVIERVPDQRGVWRATEKARSKPELTIAPPRVAMLAFDTDLGAAIWGACETSFAGLVDDVAAVITSPPYPIRDGRTYGKIDAQRWIDFICTALEPLVRRLLPGGTLAVNIGQDCFEPRSPARSLYREYFVIAMYERFGLQKLDELPVVWENPARPPGPIQWASLRRMQLNATWEPVYIFTNGDPLRCRADNRRVLQPHTQTHQSLLAAGGEHSPRSSADGMHRVRAGSYSRATAGRIPRNVLRIPHNCPDQQRTRKLARAQGLPDHPAAMPLSLAKFLVEWLTRPGDLVVDPFGGSLTTARACELTYRRWLASDQVLEYLLSGQLRIEQ